VSSECPRNTFATCSGQGGSHTGFEAEPRSTHKSDQAVLSSDPSAHKEGVRQGSTAGTSAEDRRCPFDSPAHLSNRLVASLNHNWRLLDDQLQWRLQRKKGNSRRKNSGWQDRSFCTTREALLRCVRERCGEVDPLSIATLSALPEQHALLNLDVHGTDQGQCYVPLEPLVSQASGGGQ